MNGFVTQHIIAAFIAIGVVSPTVLMLMDRVPPYEFERVEISPTNVLPGGEIEITFTVQRLRPSCGPGTVYRWFREMALSSDGVPTRKLHTYDAITRAREPEIVDGKFTRRSKLPDNISAGPVVYYGQSCYTCNPMQGMLRWPVCASTPEATFNVLEKANDRR